jgi:ribosomal protein S8E
VVGVDRQEAFDLVARDGAAGHRHRQAQCRRRRRRAGRRRQQRDRRPEQREVAEKSRKPERGAGIVGCRRCSLRYRTPAVGGLLALDG